MSLFEPFPKLARLSRECVVTEKIDGTNAQIYICDIEQLEGEEYEDAVQSEPVAEADNLRVYAGSRTRLIAPGKTTDNYGFAGWVKENAQELVKLGPGRHFGEWWGKGIQRGYGIDEKRFSLFNPDTTVVPPCCSVVPVLWRGVFDKAVNSYFTGPSLMVEECLNVLCEEGSKAAPGFMNPQGVVIYHTHARVAFKKTFDDRHKDSGVG